MLNWQNYKKKYQLIYECFGGDTAPDISQAEKETHLVV